MTKRTNINNNTINNSSVKNYRLHTLNLTIIFINKVIHPNFQNPKLSNKTVKHLQIDYKN